MGRSRTERVTTVGLSRFDDEMDERGLEGMDRTKRKFYGCCRMVKTQDLSWVELKKGAGCVSV